MGFDWDSLVDRVAMDNKSDNELEPAAESELGETQHEEAEPATEVREEAPEEAGALDEEDAWIAEEIERQERQLQEDEQGGDATERYTPRFMDTGEIRALESALRRKEVQLHREGRMREYPPQRPLVASESTGLSRRQSLHYGSGAIAQSHLQTPRFQIWSTSDSTNNGSQTARSEPSRPGKPPSPRSQPTPSAQKRVELTQALRVEMTQVRELEQRYADMKRVLLDHLEMICTSKLNDRMGSPETFEQLTELMEYAHQCATSKLAI